MHALLNYAHTQSKTFIYSFCIDFIELICFSFTLIVGPP